MTKGNLILYKEVCNTIKKAFLVLLLFLSMPMAAQTRRALVMGIGQQKDLSWAKINGDKDVLYIQQVLQNARYTDVLTLVNEQATKSAIVAAFKKLAAKCKTGDMVYVQFSGHGQLVTDVNGDEQDEWDEAWIPYDAYLKYGKKDKGEKHLIDDEINVLLTGVRNRIGDSGKLLVVVDACHSGDSSRGGEDEVIRGVKDEFIIPIKKKGKSEKASERWITLSACKDFQLNQEMKMPKVGKLTYAIYLSAQKGNVSMSEIEAIMAVLSACQTGQGKATPEGLFGLQRAFKKAGVQTLVMSLWNVSDIVTKEFMIKFYENLAHCGWNKRKAFNDAKTFISSKYADPYYWAGFVMLD